MRIVKSGLVAGAIVGFALVSWLSWTGKDHAITRHMS